MRHIVALVRMAERIRHGIPVMNLSAKSCYDRYHCIARVVMLVQGCRVKRRLYIYLYLLCRRKREASCAGLPPTSDWGNAEDAAVESLGKPATICEGEEASDGDRDFNLKTSLLILMPSSRRCKKPVGKDSAYMPKQTIRCTQQRCKSQACPEQTHVSNVAHLVPQDDELCQSITQQIGCIIAVNARLCKGGVCAHHLETPHNSAALANLCVRAPAR